MSSADVGAVGDAGRHHAQQHGAAAVDEFADTVEIADGERRAVDRDGVNSAAQEQLPRQVGGAAVQRDVTADRGDALVEQRGGHRLVDRVHRAETGDAGEAAGQRGGQQGFVELHHHRGAEAPLQFRAVARHPFGERGGEVADRTRVGDRAMPAGQLEFAPTG